MKPVQRSQARNGSSPLTRGAPVGRVFAVLPLGIIPAHAGCTGEVPVSSSLFRDHPRSRGVHGTPAPSKAVTVGSSPLTRGAPGAQGSGAPQVGIIPAHAGCTEGDECRRAHLPDHPRSRGVHFVVVCWLVGRWGSSPLTRGARGEHRGVVPLTRIIPAHAGCTLVGDSDGRHQRDHPRSRGVHLPASVSSSQPTGSSPLTRGALSPVVRALSPVGIIPAHAGCTGRPGRRPAHSGDHPRSRGVHSLTPSAATATPGSSPLTRGARRR